MTATGSSLTTPHQLSCAGSGPYMRRHNLTFQAGSSEPCYKLCQMQQRQSAKLVTSELMATGETDLEQEYRTIREALINAGLMTSNLDSLYGDWQRWRGESKIRASERLNAVALDVDQWWAQHLLQFRSLMDSAHLAARILRARKDAQQ